MMRYALPLFVAAALAVPASAAEVQIQSQGPVVELTITETVKARPDIATVSAGVTSNARTAVEAMRLNAQRMSSVVQRIQALGIAEEDVQTAGINLGAQYDYDQANRQQVFRGYQASNRVSVTLRDIERTGEVLDALVAAGATDIGGPDFSMEDDTAARAQARRAALERARALASEYARSVGYSDLRLLEVSEVIATDQPMPFARDAIMVTGARAETTPVEPGLVGTGVTVTAKYEMTG